MTTRTILGVKFLSGSAPEAVDAGLRGGLVVVPSAPVLVDIADKPVLRTAVLGADLAITDSGLMVLMWWLLTREKLERVSGLEYLKLFLEKLKLGAGSSELGAIGGVVWVMPTETARDQNLTWLQSQGFQTTEADCYVAPKYGEGDLQDETLSALVRQRRPAHIIIALGGGVQERLGYTLKRALDYRPGIHCIGAAIGFLSGEQVRIPMWVDYLYLGWLWRSVSAPGKFVPRYWKATRLVGLMWRYREKAPGVKDAET